MAKRAAALALALACAPLAAQSVNEYRLPGSDRPRPNVQGPVDPDNPVVSAPTARPTAVAPSPNPAPTAAAPSPSPGAAPQPRLVRPAPQTRLPAPIRPASAQAAPGATAGPIASPAMPQTGGDLPDPSASALPAPATLPGIALPPQEGAPLEAPEAPRLADYWAWIAAVAAVLCALLVLLWRRRRPAREPEVEFEPPVVAEPRDKPEPAPAAKPEPQRPAQGVLAASGLGMVLEARRMNASLMATTLSYNLILTNHSPEPLSALAIEGDMIAAHASMPPEQQIASNAQRLELRHALVTLAPGESARFSGDFRLPLAAITPIRAGEAAYFVPLARLRVEASTSSGGALVESRTYVIGELPEQPGAALRPFRLDLGPRNFARVGQRAVN